MMPKGIDLNTADTGVTTHEGSAKAKTRCNSDFSAAQGQAKVPNREGIEP